MNAPVEVQEMLQDFLSEAQELLDDVDAKLVELESRPDDKQLLATVFRGFHTIKGGAGFLDAGALVEVCHRAESLLDELRSGRRSLTPTMLDVILAATTAIHEMFGQLAVTGLARPADPSLIEALDAMLHAAEPAAATGAASAPALASARAVASAPGASGDDGIDWPMLLAALTGGQAAPPPPAVARPKGLAAARPMKPGEAADGSLRIDTARFDHILNLTGEICLVKNRLTCLRGEILEHAERTDARYDGTLNNFDQVVSELESLVGYLQNAVMKARMQTVGRVFQKYARVARDLGRQLGKEVELVISGEDTEIDKMMIDELNDPIVHLVRNAVDHGVETAAERAAAGKPPKSTIELKAQQSGDHILIEVIDDGRGMRPEVIRRKAIEKGLLRSAETSALDDKQSLNLIFLPGFTTNDKVTDVSGRGVGMDVVRTKIENLSGRVELHSEPGKGTRVAIVLPLTLAILPVLMFSVREQQHAIPLSMVREILPVDEASIQVVSGKPHMVVRGEVLPVLALDQILEEPGAVPPGSNSVGIVVQVGQQSLILAVDRFVGQDEVMMKRLDGFKPKGAAGATLSREGHLVVVLDLAELLAPKLAKAA